MNTYHLSEVLLVTSLVFLLLTLKALSFLSIIEGLAAQTQIYILVK